MRPKTWQHLKGQRQQGSWAAGWKRRVDNIQDVTRMTRALPCVDDCRPHTQRASFPTKHHGCFLGGRLVSTRMQAELRKPGLHEPVPVDREVSLDACHSDVRAWRSDRNYKTRSHRLADSAHMRHPRAGQASLACDTKSRFPRK